MPAIKFYKRDPIPMGMHKVKIVQKLNLLPAGERLKKCSKPDLTPFCFTTAIFLCICLPTPVSMR